MTSGELIVVAGVVVLPVVVFVFWHAANRRRLGGLKHSLAEAGFTVVDEASARLQIEGSPITPLLPALQLSPGGINWLAERADGDSPMTIIEHQKTTGTGGSMRTDVLTVAYAPLRRDLPVVLVSRASVAGNLLASITGGRVKVGHRAFDRRWAVHTDRHDDAISAFTPGVIRSFGPLGKDCSVCFGAGYVGIARPKRLDAAAANDLAERARGLAASLDDRPRAE